MARRVLFDVTINMPKHAPCLRPLPEISFSFPFLSRTPRTSSISRPTKRSQSLLSDGSDEKPHRRRPSGYSSWVRHPCMHILVSSNVPCHWNKAPPRRASTQRRPDLELKEGAWLRRDRVLYASAGYVVVPEYMRIYLRIYSPIAERHKPLSSLTDRVSVLVSQ